MQWYDFLLILLLLIALIVIWWIWWLKQETEKTGRKYPSFYYCLDGHKVRSVSEAYIDNIFTKYHIRHETEDLIAKSAGNYRYDWYLPDADIYLEFFGYYGKKYAQSRKEKEHIYKTMRMNMIPIEPEDLDHFVEKFRAKIGAKVWDSIAITPRCPSCGNQLDDRV
jgi:hypothetical protein